jgi:hypothetical protein
MVRERITATKLARLVSIRRHKNRGGYSTGARFNGLNS